MTKLKTIAFAVTLTSIFAISVVVLADTEEKKEAKKEPAKELRNQTHCPVTNMKIDSTAFTDIQGQRVYHCCPSCTPMLKADPDKFFHKAAEAGVLFENIQTTCPVSDEPLENKIVYTDYEGRRVYFCCGECIDAFAKDPKKYLDKLDQVKPEAQPSRETEARHKGHEHGDHRH